jgi:hypothetical protein
MADGGGVALLPTFPRIVAMAPATIARLIDD